MEPTKTGKRNRLADASSPYLLQHAGNPVDWYPWSPEAFMKAASEDKPVFLSIGYSTCHWCHVMEAESFSDPEVARLMNETFVCIKVDREEYPDIDNLYMAACQQMTGSGGWPLTIIMTPEKKPFFAGTYFPRDESRGRLGMLQLVPKVRDLWTRRKDKARAAADDVLSALTRSLTPEPGGRPGRHLVERTFRELAEQYDEVNGGFGSAPKFPAPGNLLFLLRYWRRTSDASAMEMVSHTLKAMRRGGIYDHLGNGIHRYSTDDRWLAPHFEKMVYDQALSVMAYTEAFQATGDAQFRDAAQGIISYVLAEMTSPGGTFYTAQDADTEGEEGKFYTWTLGEMNQLLGEKEASVAARVFNCREEGNFPPGAGQHEGLNILHMDNTSLDVIAPETGLRLNHLNEVMERIRLKLLAARQERPQPFKDTKIQTDVNGLMIAALAKAAGAFDRADYAAAAEKAYGSLTAGMMKDGSDLRHIQYDNGTSMPATLDDYAYLLWGSLELYQATFKMRYFNESNALARKMCRLFWDEQGGGFFFTPHGSGPFPFRHKFAADGALPSGNAVAAMSLLRLGRLTATPDYEKKVALVGRAFAKNMERQPVAYTHLISTLNMALGSSCEIVVVGDPAREDTLEMLSVLRRTYWPNMVAVFVPSTVKDPEIARHLPYARSLRTYEGKATAYVCKDFNCRAPTTSPDEMISTIEEIEGSSL